MNYLDEWLSKGAREDYPLISWMIPYLKVWKHENYSRVAVKV